MILALLLALTFTQVTPNRGASVLGCDTLHAIQAGKVATAHVRLSLDGKRAWEDSAKTAIGARWSLPRPALKAGSYQLLYWYSIPKPYRIGCAHVEPYIIRPAYTVDLTWYMQGAVFGPSGRMISVYEARDLLNAADTVGVAR